MRATLVDGGNGVVIDGMILMATRMVPEERLQRIVDVINAAADKAGQWELHLEGEGYYIWQCGDVYQITIAANPPQCCGGWHDLDALLKARGLA